MVLSDKLSMRLNLLKKSAVSIIQLGMFASCGWCSLTTNVDTYSVNVPMPDNVGHPGGLMLCRLASIIELLGMELWHVCTSRLRSSWTIGITRNVAGRG